MSVPAFQADDGSVDLDGDLVGADLTFANLAGADLCRGRLFEADFAASDEMTERFETNTGHGFAEIVTDQL